jgi:menaquinone-dependent protoporphyrinogen IX oxidase
MKTIIYYYTLTGNCKDIAEKIAMKLNCEAEKIIDTKKRISKGFLRFLNGGSAVKKEVAQIEEVNNIPGKFDRIIIVTPFWASSPTPAIRGFLQKYEEDLKGKKLGLALTNLGTDPEEVLMKYRELCPEPLITMSFTKAKQEWTDPKKTDRINQFIAKLEAVQ